MEKRKVRMVEGFKKRIEKICKFFFSDHDNAIRIEVEVPVSNQKLASGIRKSVDNLERLINEAEKRGMNVTLRNGIFETPVIFKKAKLEITEIKRY